MKYNRKNILVIFILVFVLLLAACDNSSAGSSGTADNQSQNNNLANANDDPSTKIPSNSNNKTETFETDEENVKKKEDKSNNVPAKKEDSSTTNSGASLKEEYLKKLNDAKRATEELEPTDSSTYALKKVENDRWELWDDLLNEIYGVLEEQLLQEEMDKLREEQRAWIQYRDTSAFEASQEFKGGTQEHLEYVAVLANLTEERSYELVEDYMR